MVSISSDRFGIVNGSGYYGRCFDGGWNGCGAGENGRGCATLWFGNGRWRLGRYRWRKAEGSQLLPTALKRHRLIRPAR